MVSAVDAAGSSRSTPHAATPPRWSLAYALLWAAFSHTCLDRAAAALDCYYQQRAELERLAAEAPSRDGTRTTAALALCLERIAALEADHGRS